MAARHIRLLLGRNVLELKCRNRCRMLLVRDVDEPQKCRRVRRAVFEANHVFVGDDHDVAILDLERHAQTRVRRPRKGRMVVQARNAFRLGHVVDVEYVEPAVPVARIEAIPIAQRMVAAMRGALPRRRLAARGPLSGRPPAADFLRTRRILQVEDHHGPGSSRTSLRVLFWSHCGLSRWAITSGPRASRARSVRSACSRQRS